MAQSRQDILEMVAKGEIDASEAAALLSGKTPAEKVPEPEKIKVKLKAESIPVEEEETGSPKVKIVEKVVGKNAGNSPKWLRIRVNNLETGKSRVRVNIPLRLVSIGLRIGRGFVPELQGIDWDDTLTHLKEGDNGLIIEVEDEDSGDHVQIFVE